MGSMKVVVPLFLLLSSIVATATEAARFCDTVYGNINPCVPYMWNGTIPMPDRCCNGMRVIKGLGDQSKSDRQRVCVCINSPLKRYPSPEITKMLASLPGACNVDLQYKIDPSTDCNRV